MQTNKRYALLKQCQIKRIARGQSRAQLAEKLGVTSASIGHWETGRRIPHVEKLSEWMKEMGYEWSEAFIEEVWGDVLLTGIKEVAAE